MKSKPPQTTQLLNWLSRINAGDLAAREDLVRGVGRRLEILTRRMLRGPYRGLRRWEQTDDVYVMALMRLFRYLDRLRPESMAAFYSLSAQQIRWTLRDLCRHYFGAHGVGANTDSDPNAPERALQPADDFPEMAIIHEVVDKLPEPERQVFDLVHYHELSKAEAAVHLGVSVRTVQRHWDSAKGLLREMIREQLRDSSLDLPSPPELPDVADAQ